MTNFEVRKNPPVVGWTCDHGLAYIGSILEFPRYLFALGFGGNGIIYGAISTEIIRDQLLQRPNAAVRLFRFDR